MFDLNFQSPKHKGDWFNKLDAPAIGDDTHVDSIVWWRDWLKPASLCIFIAWNVGMASNIGKTPNSLI